MDTNDRREQSRAPKSSNFHWPGGRLPGARRWAQALAASTLLLVTSCGGSDDAAIDDTTKPPLQWGAGNWDQVRWQ
ncbi:MAG: hypothetical protein Q8Q73_13185 [Stagnimonas sp.]|nr:hypothetical protein [Stagnimonas sp.]